MKPLLYSLLHSFRDDASYTSRNVLGLYCFLILFNVVAWVWAITELSANTVFMGAAVLAYTFGLRHAFDADHIASIDSVDFTEPAFSPPAHLKRSAGVVVVEQDERVWVVAPSNTFGVYTATFPRSC